MSFSDYSTTPSANTVIGEDTFIGPNMPRDNVRPALQQLAADGAALAGQILPSGDLAGKFLGFDASGNPYAADAVTVSGAPEATSAEIWDGALPNRYLSPVKMYDAAVPVTLTDAATIAVDMDAGINFKVTLGGNRTLGNPTNAKPGQSGTIRVAQDATGGRTLLFAANWRHMGATPSISATANAVNMFAYSVDSAGDIALSYVGSDGVGGVAGDITGAVFIDAGVTVYCSPSGSDTTGIGTASLPYRTIQKAYDSLPILLEKQCIIYLAPGTYNTNPLYGETDKAYYPRNAVLFARGRTTGSRTQNNSGTMSGPVVIKPNGGSAADTFIETSATLTFGVYVEGPTQLAIQDVTIRAGAGATEALLVSHRGGAYVHTYDVILDGNANSPSYGAYAEAGGYLEMTGTTGSVKACTTGVLVATHSGFTLSGKCKIETCATALNAQQSNVQIAVSGGSGSAVSMIASSNTVGIIATQSNIRVTGQDASNYANIDSTLDLFSSDMWLTYTNLNSTLTTRGGHAYVNTCGWQRQWTYYDTLIYLRSSNSYVSPATASTDGQPLRCEKGLLPATENTVNIVGAASALPRIAETDWIATANATTFAPHAYINIYRMRGSGGSFTACSISAANAWESREITVYNDTSSTITLTTGGALGINNTNLEVGAKNTAGVVRVAHFVFRNGAWHGN